MNNKENFRKISQRFLPMLNNLNHENKKFIIGFSGIPSSGKSSIAKKLEERYKGVRIRGDNIRRIISEERLTENKEYSEKFFK